MIASACLATQLPPEAFGVAASPELGAVMLAILQEQQQEQEREERFEKMRRHGK